MVIYRIILKNILYFFHTREHVQNRVFIFGADETGIFVKNFVENEISYWIVQGFLDTNLKNANKKLENKPVYHLGDIEKALSFQSIRINGKPLVFIQDVLNPSIFRASLNI